jgi:Bacterial tandem repeat domain 1
MKTTKRWTAQEVMKALDSLVEGNWRPVEVKGYAKGGVSLFDITWEKTDTTEPWYIYLDMPSDGFDGRKAELDKKGYKLVITHQWEVDGKKRFAAIWYPK